MNLAEVRNIIKLRQGDRTAAELAIEFDCSEGYLSQLLSGRRRPGPVILRNLGLECTTIYREIDGRGNPRTVTTGSKCGYHCCNKLISDGRKYCSRSHATYEWIYNRRRALKKQAIEYLGGKCVRCGYHKCDAALHFHHRDGDKEFTISSGSAKSWKVLLPEIKKCTLLCANCHAEEHE